MAVSVPQSSPPSHRMARNPAETSIPGTKPTSSSQSPPAYLHPAKRRRLNHSAPASESQASAAGWFDKVNRNVAQSNSGFDHDPPFYLDPIISGRTPTQLGTDPAARIPRFQTTKDDSENEDLRSVIDDLTIENKRLRQLLQERRQRYDPQLDRDKLFEVRTCDLSPEKKRELEVILTKFSSAIGDTPSAPLHLRGDELGLSSNSCAVPEGLTRSAALYSHTDSAYASMSNSGLNSVRNSNKGRAEMRQIHGSKSNNFGSCLDDIPDGLLSKHSPTMSEKSKMRLVVKRLEQLFTGKNAAPGEHSQPLQQQIISESAANTDRHNSHLLNPYNRPEGSREASILPFGSKIDLDWPKVDSWPKQLPGSKTGSERSSSDGKSASGNRSPDQRPTRPLDLDIHRAQVVEQNLDYIRHLGLPTPLRERGADDSDGGWVYLNLLINMAQLHTINVTPAFVRNSIAHLSTQFELSKDARKIRWKGGCKGTESPSGSDSGVDATTGTTPQRVGGSNPTKQFEDSSGNHNLASAGSSMCVTSRPANSWSPKRIYPTTSTGVSGQPSGSAFRTKVESTFDYKPMFIKDSGLPEDTNCCYDDSHNVTSAQFGDDVICQCSRACMQGLTKIHTRKTEYDGPIVYYKNALFYCDMSSDKESHLQHARNIPSASTQILGLSVAEAGPDQKSHQDIFIPDENAFNHHVDDESLPSLEVAELSETVDYGCNSVELSASGIGGVLPDDHFTLQVQRKLQQSRLEKAQATAPSSKRRTEHSIEEKIVSVNHFDLPPSKLPPPSYTFYSLSSESSTGLEDDQCSSVEPDESGPEVLELDQPASPAFMAKLSTESSEQHGSTNEDDNGLHSSLSAELRNSARAVELVTVAERGSDCDFERAIGMIPGSRAATVGAGSAANTASNRNSMSSTFSS